MNFKNPVVLIYLFIFLGVGFLAILASLQFVIILLMVSTFGLGIALLPIPVNLVAWLAIGWPFVLSLQTRKVWAILIGAGVSLAIAGAIFVLPAMKARSDLEREVGILTKDDTIGTLGAAPIAGIEIRNATDTNRIPTCSDLCAGLIMSGQVEWVRMVAQEQRGSSASAQTVFTAGSEDFCAPLERCPVVTEEPLGPADLLIEEGTVPGLMERNARLDPRTAKITNATRLTISDTGKREVLFQETTVHYQTVTIPIAWVPNFRELEFTGYVTYKSKVAPAPTPIVEALRRIGMEASLYKAPQRNTDKPFTKLPTSAETSAVIALLDRPSDQPFEPVDQAVIRDYISKARWFPDDNLPDLHRDVVVRVFQERRFEIPSDLDQLLRDDAPLRARVLPFMMDALEAKNPIPEMTQWEFLIALSSSYTPDMLAPYYAQYGRILASLPTDADRQWYAPIGRFQDSPLPYLSASGRTGKEHLEVTLTAFCNAAPQWEAALAGVLFEETRSFVGQSDNPRMLSWPIENAVKALAWSGYRQELDQWISSLGLSQNAHETLKRKMDRVEARKTAKHIAC